MQGLVTSCFELTGRVLFDCRLRACKLSKGLPWDAESSAGACAPACSCIVLAEVLQASHRPAGFFERRKKRSILFAARGASKLHDAAPLFRQASSSRFARTSRSSSKTHNDGELHMTRHGLQKVIRLGTAPAAPSPAKHQAGRSAAVAGFAEFRTSRDWSPHRACGLDPLP